MKHNDKDKAKPPKPQSPEPPQDHNARWPTLTIDYTPYEQHLEDSDLTDDQKRKFLDVLWSIIVSFVDLGIGIHPLQQAARNGCGKNEVSAGFLTPDSQDLVSSKDVPKIKFVTAAEGSTKPSQTRSPK